MLLAVAGRMVDDKVLASAVLVTFGLNVSQLLLLCYPGCYCNTFQ